MISVLQKFSLLFFRKWKFLSENFREIEPKLMSPFLIIQGVPFPIVFFENATVTKLLDILTCKYDFYKAKRWTF